jgi:hypothetical protein
MHFCELKSPATPHLQWLLNSQWHQAHCRNTLFLAQYLLLNFCEIAAKTAVAKSCEEIIFYEFCIFCETPSVVVKKLALLYIWLRIRR